MYNSESSIVGILTRVSRFTCYKCLSLIYDTTFLPIFVYVFIHSMDLEVCKVTSDAE